MRRRRLLWQLYLPYLLISVAALLLWGWVVSEAVENWYLDSIRKDLDQRVKLVAEEAGESITPEDAPRLQAICDRISKATGTRLTLMLPDGAVICDTEESPAKMDNHADRPEMRTALEGRIGISTRESATVRQRMMYVAEPLIKNGRLVAVVRAAVPVTPIDEVLRSLRWKIAMVGFAVALLVGVTSLAVARRVSGRLTEMRRGAERFAEGEWQYKLPLPDTEELAQLATSLNRMALHVDERVRAVVHQKNEQQAVLSSMVEGVLAVDARRRVLSLNQAAADMLRGQLNELTGRTLGEVVRQRELLDFVDRALAEKGPVAAELTMWGEPERIVQARGTTLRDVEGTSLGAVIVLHDVTQFRRLETLRRDFVANVSHELKTPVASIKGFVETLLDGALDNPQETERFLQIVSKQADRLHTLIEDLLSLSRIEQSEQTGAVALEVGPLKPALEEAIEACQPAARDRNIQLTLRCPDDLQARLHAPLLEQAVANLIDNAVKYSEPGREVVVEAAGVFPEIVISVRDWGVGIEAEHLPRIFERFYRVDKARSRKLGGTGLGLAIVKHVVHAHGGRITVESTPGQGSTFTIYLRKS
jgi:two-component system phosphate regulon sensor histidine kinase PhoR